MSIHLQRMQSRLSYSVHGPTFWTAQPEVWFVQAEAQFNFRII